MVGIAFGQGNVTNTGSWINTGTVKANNFTNSTAPAAFTNSGGSSSLQIRGILTTNANDALPANFDVETAGEVRYYKTATQNVNHQVKNNTYANLYLTGSGAKTLTGVATVTGTATADAASLAISTHKLTVTAATPFSVANAGTFSFGTGEVDYNGTTQNVFSETYGTLTISNGNTKTMAGPVIASTTLNINAGTLSIGANTLTAAGTISDNSGAGTITGGTTSNLIINGSGDVTLPVITGTNLGNFTYNRPTNFVNLASNATVNGTLTATAGVLHVKSYTLELIGSVTGTTGGFASDLAGTVFYNGSAGQSVFGASYGNLSFNNNTKNLSAAAVNIAGIFTPGAGTGHTITGSTIAFNGGTQNIPQFNGVAVDQGYNNLQTSGGAKTMTGDILVTGDFANGSGVTTTVGSNGLTIIGSKSQGNDAATMQFAGATNGLIFTTGTVDYNGTDQTITGDATPASNFYRLLLLSNVGTKTVTGATNIVRTESNLTVNDGVALSVASSGDLRVEGDLTNNGSVTNAGTITVGVE